MPSPPSLKRFFAIAIVVLTPLSLFAQNSIRFDAATRVFRIDTPAVTYAVGVNAQDELQSIYWGAAIAPTDPLPTPVRHPEVASFDGPTTVTPFEYPRRL